MKYIKPVTITDAILTSSSIPETDYTAWNSGTAYVVGNYCIRVSTHRIYQCLVNNTNFIPEDNLTGVAPKWVEIGPTNRWAMFDVKTGTKSSDTSPLIVTLGMTETINSLAIVNVDCTKATVYAEVDGAQVYLNEIDMLSGKVILDWYDYFFAPVTYKKNLSLIDLPNYDNLDVTITLEKPTNSVSCGSLVVGNTKDLGFTQYDPTLSITDYSVKSTDAFGNWTIVQRPFSRHLSCKTIVKNYLVDDIYDNFTDILTVPVVWIGDDSGQFGSMLIYGFYKSFDITIAYVEEAVCTLEIEGLT